MADAVVAVRLEALGDAATVAALSRVEGPNDPAAQRQIVQMVNAGLARGVS